MSEENKIVELKEEELNKVVGGGSTIYTDSTDYWLCVTWMHYHDGLEDDFCECEYFSSNDPVCVKCPHAANSQK